MRSLLSATALTALCLVMSGCAITMDGTCDTGLNACDSACQASSNGLLTRIFGKACDSQCDAACDTDGDAACDDACDTACDAPCDASSSRKHQRSGGIFGKMISNTSACDTNCDDACDSNCDDACDTNCDDACDGKVRKSHFKGGLLSKMTSNMKNCDDACDTNCDDACDTDCDDACDSSCDDACDGKVRKSHFKGGLLGKMTSNIKNCDDACDTNCDDACDTDCDDACDSNCDDACDSKGCKKIRKPGLFDRMTTNMRACDTACDSNEDNACDSNAACDSPASAGLCDGLFSKCDSIFDRRRGPVTMNFCSKDCDSNCDSNGCDSDCDTSGCDSSCGGKKAGGLLSGFLSGHAQSNCATNANGNRLAMHGFGSGNHHGGLGGHGVGGGLLNPGSHLSRLHAHHGLGLLSGRQHPYGGEIPHTANPAGAYGMQGGNPAPTYAYPYYTTRGPRDFLSDGCGAAPIAPHNPRSPLCLPSIGW